MDESKIFEIMTDGCGRIIALDSDGELLARNRVPEDATDDVLVSIIADTAATATRMIQNRDPFATRRITQ